MSLDDQTNVTSAVWTRLFRGAMLILLVGSVTACSDFRRAIGTEKSAPDEFEVVVRPPLSMPPGFANTPDQVRADEDSVLLDARRLAGQTLGVENVTATGYDALFDFASIEENIREKVDEETLGIQFEKRLPIQTLFGGLPDVGPVLDKIAEDRRLRRTMREGLLPTDGETLATDQSSGETVIIK